MIYLDFEGFINKPPTFVGYLFNGQFTQVIFDETFLPIAKEKGLKFQKYDEFCIEILKTSNQSGQPITAWSEREKEELDKFDIPYQYCNLLNEVKALIKKNERLHAKHQEMPEYWKYAKLTRAGRLNPAKNRNKCKTWSLTTILKLFNYSELGTGYGSGKVTSRIRAIQSGLRARGTYEDLTLTQKSKWTKLQNHNRVDVEGMLFIVEELNFSLKK